MNGPEAKSRANLKSLSPKKHRSLARQSASAVAALNEADTFPASAYCAGFIELDPISRVSFVMQLICRLYLLGVWV